MKQAVAAVSGAAITSQKHGEFDMQANPIELWHRTPLNSVPRR